MQQWYNFSYLASLQFLLETRKMSKYMNGLGPLDRGSGEQRTRTARAPTGRFNLVTKTDIQVAGLNTLLKLLETQKQKSTDFRIHVMASLRARAHAPEKHYMSHDSSLPRHTGGLLVIFRTWHNHAGPSDTSVIIMARST
jgi:hypothetical protein